MFSKKIAGLIILILLAGIAFFPSSAQNAIGEPSESPQSFNDLPNPLIFPLVFLSKPSSPPTIDLFIQKIVVTQGSQTYTTSVPLVTDRPAVLRVLAKTSDSTPTPGIRTSLSAYRDGSLLPGSPLISEPGEVPVTPSRAWLNTTYNFLLPPNWLTGSVTFEVHLDSSSALFETDESNNTSSLTVTFGEVPPIYLKFVPINYFHDTGSGYKLYPAPQKDHMSDDLMDLFPVPGVNVSLHSPINFYGDLRSEYYWEDLLNKITALKKSSQAPDSEVWYGAIPIEDYDGGTWFYGGIAGVGWIGFRESIGLYDSADGRINGGNVAAHEVGHNFGRFHAPCGVPTADYAYPYSDGRIGQYGFDVSDFTPILYSVKDFMSYCDPNWISDYNYKGLRSNQLVYGAFQAQSASEPVMMVRIRISGDGSYHFDPIYEFDGVVSRISENSDYEIELLDQNMEVISRHSVPIMHAEEPEISINSIIAVIPKPVTETNMMRLIKNGETVLENVIQFPISKAFLNSQPAEPEILFDADSTYLTWDFPQVPAMVRYRDEQINNWNTLAVDITGGRVQIFPDSLPQGKIRFEITYASNDLPPVYFEWSNLASE
jgi:hypothetical protein